MFTQPAGPPKTTGPGNLAVSPVSASAVATPPPPRTSRLRGLNYLRSYTQTHLLSREHSSHSASTTPQPTSSSLSPAAAPSPPCGPATALAADTASNPSSSSRTNRLSQLVSGLPPLPSGGRSHAHAAPRRRSTESSAIFSVNTTDTPGAGPPPEDMTRARSATAGDASARHEGGSNSMGTLPSIRFSTFYDPRATRPSLKFAPISRTLPTGREVIRVGRYSERDNQPNVPANTPSAGPVGFKSKVVSRRHCEFWYEDGKWYIKDVKSSSGTFLNHIRLSPPGTESKPYPVNDGDIVQLGIDFKGGEEMIFRCVKMRLELNRGWQNKLNTFNMATHKRLRNMTAGSANNASGSYSQDCSICLNSIAPCQCLFVAPCSHTWHYKCIRSLLSSPSYPIFICPNCRAAADLEAEVEDPEEWEQLDSDEGCGAAQEGALLQAPSGPTNPNTSTNPSSALRGSRDSALTTRQQPAQQPAPPQQPQPQLPQAELPDVTMFLDSPRPTPPPPPQQPSAQALPDGGSGPTPVAAALAHYTSVVSHATSHPVPIPPASASSAAAQQQQQQRILQGGNNNNNNSHGRRTPSPTGGGGGGGGGGGPVVNGHEGPITPRNEAGPWVFDGSGVRLRADGGFGVGVNVGGEGGVGGGVRVNNSGGAGLGGNGGGGMVEEDEIL